MKIISVVGARPNFMKIAPIHKAFEKIRIQKSEFKIKHLICHTGQHYDEKMSKVFFEDLELPKPDFYLGIGSGSHAEQTAKVMIEFEKVLIKEKPDLIIVVGDVNSTIACSLTAVKLGIKIAHVEAGLRSFDRNMPEEINRILTDIISDFLFVTEKSGMDNLKREGIDERKVFFVGNVMIDSLINYTSKINYNEIADKYNVIADNYIIITLHRPSNVDDVENLSELVSLIQDISAKSKIIFSVHPRTKKYLEKYNLIKNLNGNVQLTEPLGYIEFITLVKKASLVITDSGGIQEETTFLKVPCITLRTSTERPVTVDIGTNYLVGNDLSKARELTFSIIGGNSKSGEIPPLWDGKTSERIVEILVKIKN
jgi:UDP-N-acetylglucosamine 2-epimerase (non-hydrolysing)